MTHKEQNTVTRNEADELNVPKNRAFTAQAVKLCGINKGTFSSWRNGRYDLGAEKLEIVKNTLKKFTS